jgi:hypothetical protein
MKRSDELRLRLSWRLLGLFSVGIPLLMLLLAFGALTFVFQGGSKTVELVWLGVTFLVVGAVALRWATFASISVSGDRVHISRWRDCLELPVSDLRDVLVVYRKGIPFARFTFGDGRSSHFRRFWTVLRPDLSYLVTGRLSDLDVFRGTPVRYKDLFGRTRGHTIGESAGAIR